MGGLLLAVLAAGCVTDGSMRAQPVKAIQGPVVLHRGTSILREPRQLGRDYAYPARMTKQVFSWENNGEAEWKVTLEPSRYAFAGFTFRRPYDFASNRERFGIKFRMRPAGVADHLAICLLDGKQKEPQVLVELPLTPFRTTRRGDWDYFLVRLDAFDAPGRIVTALTPEGEPYGQPIDWSDISEIRISSLASKRPVTEVTIRQLKFTPVRLPEG